MSNYSRFLATLISAIIIVTLLSLIFLSNSFGNSNPNLMVTQPTSTPQPQTITPTLAPTSSPAPTPTATPSPTLIPVPIDFKYSNDGITSTSSVIVAVDLNDGMDRAEAIAVAETIFNHEATSCNHIVKSAEVNSDGSWKVNLSWGTIAPNGEQEDLTHIFILTINPVDRTVTYFRCM